MALVRCAVITLVVATLLPLLGAFLASNAIVRPPWYRHTKQMVEEQAMWDYPKDSKTWIGHMGLVRDPKSDLNLDYLNISFPSRNPGYTLRGWYIPPADPSKALKVGVIAQHGGGHDRRECLRIVPIFHNANMPVILYDASEHGISDGDGGGLGYGYREMFDLMGAVDHAEQKFGWDKVVVFGTSVGAATVIKAASEDKRIDLVIAENAFFTPEELWDHAIQTALGTAGFGGRDINRFGAAVAIIQRLNQFIPRQFIDLIISIAKIRVGGWRKPAPSDVIEAIAPRPLLFIHSKADDVIPWDHTERLFEKCSEPKDKLVTETGRHAAVYNDNQEAFVEKILGFLQKHIPEINAHNRKQ